MNITASRVTRVNDPYLRAVVSLTLDNGFVIHGFRIVEVNKYLLVQMPTTVGAHGQPYEYVLPASPEMRDFIENSILRIYLEEEEAESDPVLTPLAPAPSAISATAEQWRPVHKPIDEADIPIGYFVGGWLRKPHGPNA